jgi:hypothetical protein
MTCLEPSARPRRSSARIRPWVSALAWAALASACADEPEPATWPRVQEIFDAHGCATATCHSVSKAEGELVLADEEPDGAYHALVGAPCANGGADDDGMLRVAPGDADASFLLTKLSLTAYDPIYGEPMPVYGPPLTDEELDLVRRWVLAGAPID